MRLFVGWPCLSAVLCCVIVCSVLIIGIHVRLSLKPSSGSDVSYSVSLLVVRDVPYARYKTMLERMAMKRLCVANVLNCK